MKQFALALLVSAVPTMAAAQAHQFVDVGDHRLDVIRAGAGAPTVVLEAGLGDSLEDWASIWPAIAGYTTVVAYSRAGFGRSEPGAPEHTVRRAATELHALLAGLQLRPPYVLVARSYGSIIARLYTSLYPAEVAGLVLVDGTHEQQVQRWGTIDSRYPAEFRAFFDSVLAHTTDGPEAAEIRETVRIQTAGAVEGLTPLPDIPMAILTSMKSDSAAAYVNGTPRGHDVWRALHDEWFRRSSNAIHIETARSGHAIQDDEPELVIDAIRFVLDRVRAQR